MAGFKIDVFRGMRPRVSKEKLAEGEGETVQNIDLGSGDLVPYDENATEQALNKQALTIYKYPNDGNPIWFEWEDYVDVVPGPVKDDSLERVYYVGDTTGDGKPKLTSNVLADQGGGGPYPEGWWYIGVPAPTAAPTVTPSELPEDKDPALRIASQFRTDEFQIDKVQYTVYPGTGTDNDTWRLNSGALGSIAFDVLIGTAFRVKEVISVNVVTIESATEPGITMRTANSDQSTVNDWHPMDEQGSTKQADFMGWRVPPGMEVKIPGHNLNVGDVIVVSAINGRPEFYSSLTQDHYAQDWSTEKTVNIDGTDEYIHRNERISASATSGDTQYEITGTFYYDVDRASSTVSELEDRTYVYTYVNSLGEEGPPSPPSTVTPILDGDDVLITGMELPPTIGYDITKIRLYRSNSTEAGTEYQFVKEIDVTRTVRDAVKSADLGEVIPSTSWDPPPADLAFLASMPNGMLVGGKGRSLYFCDPYRPHAWPADYDQAIDYDIVGGISFSNAICVLTKGWPYIITGSHPRNAAVRPIKINQACVSKQSIATDGDRVYYASPDGIVEISSTGAVLKTENILSKKNWQAYSPSTMVGGFYEGKYYGFYDFDVTAVDPVITAELSGTVTNADEDDIIEGSLTLEITLTNDQWVAAGTAFDNQRANIIAGLDAATSQTLGWNNLIRDTALTVTDVVRTNDSTVTITLPAVAGYSITAAEVITCTIPATALILSNTAVIAGSTFTITPQEHQTTVTLSGTLDGGAEASIVSGGLTLIATLTNDTWEDASTLALYYDELITKIVSSTDEDGGWNDTVQRKITSANIARTSDTVLTITLPAVADYAVTENETITLTVPHEMLVTKENVDVAAANSVGIIATGAPAAIFSGTVVSGGVTENEIVAGGETIIITLSNETWVAAGATFDAQRQNIIDSLISDGSATNGWNNELIGTGGSGSLDVTHVVRTSDTVCTITLPADAQYSIANNETISCTLPATAVTGGLVLPVSNTFSITAQAPITVALSGTVTGTNDQNDIQAGGLTIILTVSDDTWKSPGTGPIGSTADTQAIIDGITASTTPTNGWNNIVRDTALSPANVVRTSNTVCTITLPAAGTYDSGGIDEVITATVPAAALNISGSAVVASPTFTVLDDIQGTAAATGTADGATSDQIVAGGKTIILTLTEDEWVASGAVFNAQRQNIIDGLSAASSPATGWNNVVRDSALLVTNVVRTSNTVVTITLPACNYDVNADEVITCTIPASALAESSIPIVASNTIDITAVSNSTSRLMAYWYTSSVGYNDSKHRRSFYDIDEWYAEEAITGATDDYYPTAGALSVPDSKWAFHTSPGSTDQIVSNVLFSAVNDGTEEALTNRTSNFLFSYDSGGCIYYSTRFDYFFRACASGMEYSTNGTSWTDFSSAVQGPYSSPTHSLTNVGSERNQVMYGGSQYVYAVMKELTGNDRNLLARSPDLSGAGTPTGTWTLCTSALSGDADIYGSYGTGNGLILHIGYDGPLASQTQTLAYMTHGSTTFTKASGSGIPALGFGVASKCPSFIRYGGGVWLAMNEDGDYIRCDTVGGTVDETNSDNWDSTGGTGLEGTGYVVKDLWYDYGSGSDDGLGWICVIYNSSANEGYVFQSADGSQSSWTKIHTETGVNNYHAFPEYPIDGAPLD